MYEDHWKVYGPGALGGSDQVSSRPTRPFGEQRVHCHVLSRMEEGSRVGGILSKRARQGPSPSFFRSPFPSHFVPLSLYFLSPMMNTNVHSTRYVPDHYKSPSDTVHHHAFILYHNVDIGTPAEVLSRLHPPLGHPRCHEFA